MKKFFLKILIISLTFAAGIGIYRLFIPKVSLSEISENISYYNEKNVEIETFVILQKDNTFRYLLSDFDKKTSSVMSVYFADEFEFKQPKFLQTDSTDQNSKRVKVLIKGKVFDECSIDGKPTCCFFKAIAIEDQEIIQISPVED